MNNNASSYSAKLNKLMLGLMGLIRATYSSKQRKITMQDRHL